MHPELHPKFISRFPVLCSQLSKQLTDYLSYIRYVTDVETAPSKLFILILHKLMIYLNSVINDLILHIFVAF